MPVRAIETPLWIAAIQATGRQIKKWICNAAIHCRQFAAMNVAVDEDHTGGLRISSQFEQAFSLVRKLRPVL